ncbi:MAG TPA: HlyD family efflux transporter periplasmic adaptor subunit [Kofleriaceae bacterium]|nr:HlyD family efflux transporter periplasmic adaptor subunit [Kofleriaceae bacterium]
MKPHSLVKCLAALLLVAACSGGETAPNEPDPTEAVHEAAKPEAPKAPEFVGVISSRVSKVIAADFDSKVERLNIRNGQRVKEGEIVAELATEELQAKLAQAKGTFDAAKGQRARAGAAYANAARRARLEQRLIRSGASAPESLNNIRAESSQFGAEGSSAAGEMARAAAQIKELEALLARAKVPAPIDGVVSIVKAREGANLSKAEQIARVFDPNQLVVRFAVPKKHLSLVKPGTAIELVTTEGHRVVPATVRVQDDTADPTIDFTVFEAVIDPTFRTDEIRVGDNGHVRIAGAAK